MSGIPHTHHWFACGWFARLMSTLGGRLGRSVAGLLLVGGGLGIGLAVIGGVPLAAGLFDLCVFSALFGGPLGGSAIRTCPR